MSLARLLAYAAEALLPHFCLICDKRIRAAALCSGCTPHPVPHASRCTRCYSAATDLNSFGVCSLCCLIPLAFHRQRYIWDYSGHARNLLRTAKYRPSHALMRRAASLLADELENLFDPELDWDIVTVVPSSRASFIKRGFNPCAPLAAAVRAKLKQQGRKCEFGITLLEHRRPVEPQASLPHRRRIANVRAAFKAESHPIAGKNILLVEDIITTGATSTAAALALYRAGAARVDLLALARARSWTEYRQAIYEMTVERALVFDSAANSR